MTTFHLPPVGQRTYPNQLPQRWWTLPTRDLETWLRPMVWPSTMPLTITGPSLEALLLHHPRLVARAMAQGLRPRQWPQHFDAAGQLRSAPGPETSALRLIVLHGDAPALDLALRHAMVLTTNEHQAWPSLDLAVLTASRLAAPGTPLASLTPAQRTAREGELLRVLQEHRQRKGIAPTGEPEHVDDLLALLERPDRRREPLVSSEPLLVDAVRQNVPNPVLDALTEHGLAGPGTSQVPALRELMARGDPAQTERFLRWGLPLGHGPGDDLAALDVMHRTLPRHDEDACRQRQVAMLDTLERHGWVPGPRFRREAVSAAAGAGAPGDLLPALIVRNADPLARDEDGNTALHRIFRPETHQDLVQALLDLGVDPTWPNTNGDSPLGRLRRNVDALYRQGSSPSDDQLEVLERMERSVRQQLWPDDLGEPGSFSAPGRRPRL